MPNWNVGNGDWQAAASWTGGVPNAAGAIANFNSTAAGPAINIVTFTGGAVQTVGTMNFSSTGGIGFIIRGLSTNTTAATLRFEGVGGAAAQINAENTGVATVGLSGFGKMNFVLVSDLIVTTIGAGTVFIIDDGLTGSGELTKNGLGTLLLQSASGNASTFSGGLRINGGVVQLEDSDAGLGTGVVTLRNGAVLRSSSGSQFDTGRVIDNTIETGTGASGTGVITAAAGFSVTLAGAVNLRAANANAITFGSLTDTGVVVIGNGAVSSVVAGAGFNIAAGFVRLGGATAAQQFFNFAGNGQTQIAPGAQLNTGGFATTIQNLDFDGGALTSSVGVLNVTANMTTGPSQVGTVTGTAGTDRLVFNVATTFCNLLPLTFASWNSSIDTIQINGDATNNQLDGSSQNDEINGGGGDDILTGNGGLDVLRGGSGNDIYGFTGTETLVELANEGSDTIEIAATGPTVFVIPTNFENISFGSTVAHAGIGNTADNTITGNIGADELQGREGNDTLNDGGDASADTLIGGIGDDIYIVGNRGSSTVELVGEGIDEVRTTFSIFALQNNVENLTATDNASHGALVGNALDNVITGGTGTDDLFGREGNDTLTGGSGAANTLLGQEGDDTYFVFVAGDSVIELAGQGIDTVRTTAGAYTLSANVENLTCISVIGTFTGIGNAENNTITGAVAGDFLSGLNGNDILIGANGADTLLGGAGADQFRYNGGETGFDRILDFVSGTDKIALANTGFTHTATISFVFGPAATALSAFSTFLYDTNTGIVSYDADGNGVGAAVQLAQLNLGQALTGADFVFV